MANETPDTVHGRLLEAAHISGYTFERACGELEWLLDKDRWRQVGSGYSNVNEFLKTIDLSQFKIALTERKKLARQLKAVQASQRATAKVLGVTQPTVRRDLGLETNVSPAAINANESCTSLPAGETNVSPAWFQTDVDPTKEAKHVATNLLREGAREQQRSMLHVPPLPEGRFRLLYADPPWRYEHVETESRAIENQYPTMALDEIKALKVPAADDAVLFLWATSPKLAEAIEVIAAWDFSYRTCAVWDKEVIGMGYYFRQQHELLLVAARGALLVPEASNRQSSVIRARRNAHSSKPAIVYDLLEAMYPHFAELDRIELFCRTPRVGWSAWGTEQLATQA